MPPAELQPLRGRSTIRFGASRKSRRGTAIRRSCLPLSFAISSVALHLQYCGFTDLPNFRIA